MTIMENIPTEKEISRLLDEGKVVVIGRERGCVVTYIENAPVYPTVTE